MFEEHGIHINIDVTRKWFWYVAREVRIVMISDPPCGHEQCKEQLSYGPVVGRALTPMRAAHKALYRILPKRAQELKDARDRAASESLGG